jgi:hypothetical protein
LWKKIAQGQKISLDFFSEKLNQSADFIFLWWEDKVVSLAKVENREVCPKKLLLTIL